MAGATNTSNVCSICGSAYDGEALFCPKDGAPLGSAALAQRDPYIGTDIGGAIHIEQLIGIGSMGRVYRAFQRPLGRAVAVKILHKELSANAAVVARFEREAQIVARLSHPNVIQVITAGRAFPEQGDAGPLYIVMEYLDGISLRSALAAAAGPLPLVRALRIAVQLCEAVGEAHVQGIVHRDIKPENVMLLKRGRGGDFVKVLDFGIARLPFGATPAVTKAGLVFGTARYISPEGAAGTPVGPAADVYSIVTILYQMLAGRTPFEGASSVDVLAQQMNEPPPPLASMERARGVPAEIATVIMENLGKKPEQRRPDGRALGRALFAAARAAGLTAEELWVPASLATPAPTAAKTLVQPPDATAAERTQLMEHAPPGALEDRFTHGEPPDASASAETAARPAGPRRGIIFAFLAGCALCGALLAVIGAFAWREPEPSARRSPGTGPSFQDASVDR